jgi:hypothetical protein
MRRIELLGKLGSRISVFRRSICTKLRIVKDSERVKREWVVA